MIIIIITTPSRSSLYANKSSALTFFKSCIHKGDVCTRRIQRSPLPPPTTLSISRHSNTDINTHHTNTKQLVHHRAHKINIIIISQQKKAVADNLIMAPSFLSLLLLLWSERRKQLEAKGEQTSDGEKRGGGGEGGGGCSINTQQLQLANGSSTHRLAVHKQPNH